MSVRDDDIRRNDDHEFEGYLKQFHPAIPQPLPRQIVKLRRRTIKRVVWAAAVACVVIAGALMLDYKFQPKRMADVPLKTQAQPLTSLTISRANQMLFESDSIEDTLNVIAYPSQISLPQGANSALSTLGKEKFKL